MRSRRSSQEDVAEVARRRLELLGAELAAIRPSPDESPSPLAAGGSGELPASSLDATPAPSGEGLAEPRPGRASGRHARRPVGSSGRLTGWLEDRMPAALHGRVQLGAAHLAVLAVVVALAMGLLAWRVVRAADPGDLAPTGSAQSTGPGTPLVTPGDAAATGAARGSTGAATGASSGAAGGSGAAPAARSSPSATDLVVVDVSGKVRRPGIVTLPLGSRVVDALEAAGGARRRVRLVELNLARPLVDGEQILVGVRPPGGVAAPAASGTEPSSAPAPLVPINRADQSQLETLPGVGPVTAQKILDWRAANGPFSAVDELLEVSGIGEATLAEIAPFVTL